MNQTLTKPETDVTSRALRPLRREHASAVLDTIKELGFSYSTHAGVTVSKNDIVIPPDKEKILGEDENRVEGVHGSTTAA